VADHEGSADSDNNPDSGAGVHVDAGEHIKIICRNTVKIYGIGVASHTNRAGNTGNTGNT